MMIMRSDCFSSCYLCSRFPAHFSVLRGRRLIEHRDEHHETVDKLHTKVRGCVLCAVVLLVLWYWLSVLSANCTTPLPPPSPPPSRPVPFPPSPEHPNFCFLEISRAQQMKSRVRAKVVAVGV